MTSCGYPKIPASYGSGRKGARMQNGGNVREKSPDPVDSTLQGQYDRDIR